MSVSKQEIVDYLARLVGIDASQLQGDTPLFSSGLLDSFTLVDLISFVESKAGLRVPATDVNLENLDSVDRILDYVKRRNDE